jgi:hypothetical protein
MTLPSSKSLSPNRGGGWGAERPVPWRTPSARKGATALCTIFFALPRAHGKADDAPARARTRHPDGSAEALEQMDRMGCEQADGGKKKSQAGET